MKRMILSNTEANALVHNMHLPKSEWLPKLHMKVSEVKDKVLQNVKPEDKDIMSWLIANKVIPTIASSSEMRNNPYYELEDKLIDYVDSTSYSNRYSVPYAASGLYGSGNIYAHDVEINADANSVAFGSSNFYNIDKYSPKTLKSYFRKSLY